MRASSYICPEKGLPLKCECTESGKCLRHKNREISYLMIPLLKRWVLFPILIIRMETKVLCLHSTWEKKNVLISEPR